MLINTENSIYWEDESNQRIDSFDFVVNGNSYTYDWNGTTEEYETSDGDPDIYPTVFNQFGSFESGHIMYSNYVSNNNSVKVAIAIGVTERNAMITETVGV